MIGLEITDGEKALLWRPLDSSSLLVGRNPECDLSIPDETLPGVLCRLERRGTALFMHPVGDNTVRVNGESLAETMQLAQGDEIDLGALKARVRFEQGAEPSAGGQTRLLSRGQDPTSVFQMVIRRPDQEAMPIVMEADTLTVGKDPSCDVCLEDDYVSGFHARFILEDGRLTVRDLDSKNGILLQGVKVREAEVDLGMSLTLGQTRIDVMRADAEVVQESDLVPMVGASKAMDRVSELVARLANNDASVLITGETGTGKEVVAAHLVAKSQRHEKPFIAVNCGALTRELIESELFGHEKGAFTGAISRKLGAFEAADGGTLFLDEIGELPLDLQPQLLRVLELGEVRRVGSTETHKVNVRVLAATNRELAAEVADGKFREDLLHRLHVLHIEVPPLRQRLSDIEPLTQHFIRQFAPQESITLEVGAVEKLKNHFWSGNIRELKNVIQRAVLMRKNPGLLTEDDISFVPSTLQTRVEAAAASGSRTLKERERDAMIMELQRHQGNQLRTAEALGVSRSTIHRKLEEHGINIDDYKARS